MRILILHPNTSESMTAEIAAAARAAADPGTEIVAAKPRFGAAVALAQALVGLGLTTSKVGVLAEGPPNPRTHWPISTALGVEE